MNKTLLVINLFFPFIKCVNLNLVCKDLILLDPYPSHFILPSTLNAISKNDNFHERIKWKWLAQKSYLKEKQNFGKFLADLLVQLDDHGRLELAGGGDVVVEAALVHAWWHLLQKICWVMLSNKTSIETQRCKNIS